MEKSGGVAVPTTNGMLMPWSISSERGSQTRSNESRSRHYLTGLSLDWIGYSLMLSVKLSPGSKRRGVAIEEPALPV